MTRVISIEDLKGLFTKPYGTDAPTKQKWADFYTIFTDVWSNFWSQEKQRKAKETSDFRVHLAILWNSTGLALYIDSHHISNYAARSIIAPELIKFLKKEQLIQPD